MTNRELHKRAAARSVPPRGEPDQTANRGHPRWGIRAFVAGALAVFAAGPVVAQADLTLPALEIAYGRECNARLHYGAYASRAELEGYPGAALAFRAAAVGESVHAARHAARIEELGGQPAWSKESVVIRTTEENLCTAIYNEAHERAFVYPQLADQVRPECDFEALASFRYARDAEATHAALFAEALKTIAEHAEVPGMIAAGFAGYTERGTDQVAYWVCMGDGSVFLHELDRACPNCGIGSHEVRAMTHAGRAVRD